MNSIPAGFELWTHISDVEGMKHERWPFDHHHHIFDAYLCILYLYDRDTAGKQKYESLSELFYRGVMGVIYCFDLTNKNSFKNVEKWIHKLTMSSHCKYSIASYFGAARSNIAVAFECCQSSCNFQQYFKNWSIPIFFLYIFVVNNCPRKYCR